MAYFDIRFLAVMLKVQFLAGLLQLMAKLRSTQSNLNFAINCNNPVRFLYRPFHKM